MRPLLILALLALAGCGADGPPLRPAGSVGAGPAGAEVGAGVDVGGAFSLGLSL